MSSVSRRSALKTLAAVPLAVSASAEAQSTTKTLRHPFEVAETGFDPVQLNDLYSRIVTAHLYEGLYRYDHLARPFKLKPCTARGMPEVSDDFRVWTVRVQPEFIFRTTPRLKANGANSLPKIMCMPTSAISILGGSRLRWPA